MYFEKHHSFVNRHHWTFPISGANLLHAALELHGQFAEAETKARETAAKLLRDARVHHEDKRVIAAKNDIVKYGQLREKCAVWAYEFERTPDREFLLGVNDISFFNSNECPLGASNRNEWKFAYKAKDLVAAFRQKAQALKKELNGLKFRKETPEEVEARQEVLENNLLANAFEANPEKDINLSLGDVVYLGLAPLLNLDATS